MGRLRLRGSDDARRIEARIRDAVARLRPMLHLDSSQLELVGYEPESGTAVLLVEGDCPDCEMSVHMLMQGIEAHLRQRVPEIRAIRVASSRTTDPA